MGAKQAEGSRVLKEVGLWVARIMKSGPTGNQKEKSAGNPGFYHLFPTLFENKLLLYMLLVSSASFFWSLLWTKRRRPITSPIKPNMQRAVIIVDMIQ